MYVSLFKPVSDRVIGFLGIVFLSPVLLILTIVVCVHFSGNPFFFQKRVGKNERIFYIVKFRTMHNTRNGKGELLSDKVRLTGLGRVLRKFSLDELPQFFNLLSGDMSLIGPRPLLVEYLGLYNAEQAKRHLVKPGITGLAQVNGRNGISWERKFYYDLIYVEEQSFKLDAYIFFRSFFQLIDSSSVYGEGGDVEPFKGNKS